jgi:nucleolar protein 56
MEQTGTPPSKNADAMRKVLDALDDEASDSDEDMVPAQKPKVTAAVSSKEDRHKEGKRKRKSELDDSMDVDEQPVVKKKKRSKEDKGERKLGEDKGERKERKEKEKKREKEKGVDAFDESVKRPKDKKEKKKKKGLE